MTPKRGRKPAIANNENKYHIDQNAAPVETDDVFQTEPFFSNMNSENIFKDLLSPGSDIDFNMLRGWIKNDDQLNIMCLAYARYERWNDTEHKQLLAHRIIGSAGVQGRARIEAVAAYTGIFPEDVVLHMMGSKMSREEKQRFHQSVNQQQDSKIAMQRGNTNI
jgi:hypothetical protein